MSKSEVQTETAAETVVENISAEDTSAAVVETTDLDDDDAGASAELDAIFDTAIETTDLEEGGDGDSGKDGEEKVGESTTVEVEGEAAEEAGTGEAPAETAAAEELEATPTVEEPAKEELVVEQPTTEPPIDPAQVQADYQKWRGDAEELLASQHYALTEEQAEEFDSNPGAAIPKLAARLHMEVMAQSVAMIAGLLPKIMANVNQAQTVETQRETEFFKEWPELVGHRDQVVRHGAVYYQMNPQATFQEFLRDVGAQVAVSQKVDLSGRQTAAVETPRTPAHKPLSASGGPGVGASVVKPGVFETLAEEAAAEDHDY